MPLLVLAALLPLPLHAAVAASPAEALPDAPMPTAAAASSSRNMWGLLPSDVPGTAPRLTKYIQPNQRALPLSAKDKLELAGWEQLQPYAFGTAILSAGWEHLLDSNPRYGSDKAGFGERLGAAYIRQSSQAIFSDGVLPAMLHQDPRYYRLGTGTLVHRVLYAASRVLVTRTDAGAEAPNYSQIFGYAGASALTMTYYPAVSATWGRTAEGYVSSLAASALGNQVHEFGPDAIRLLRRWRHK